MRLKRPACKFTFQLCVETTASVNLTCLCRGKKTHLSFLYLRTFIEGECSDDGLKQSEIRHITELINDWLQRFSFQKCAALRLSCRSCRSSSAKDRALCLSSWLQLVNAATNERLRNLTLATPVHVCGCSRDVSDQQSTRTAPKKGLKRIKCKFRCLRIAIGTCVRTYSTDK
jgi:hypothetical protein